MNSSTYAEVIGRFLRDERLLEFALEFDTGFWQTQEVKIARRRTLTLRRTLVCYSKRMKIGK